MFSVDCTATECVLVCHECGWRGLAMDNLDGWRKCRNHEHQHHPGTLHASVRYSAQMARHIRT